MSAKCAVEEKTVKPLRSLLFVPADRPERFAKAAASGADAIIIDLEDSVAPANKQAGRDAAADWLRQTDGSVITFVRINPLDSEYVKADLECLAPHWPDAIVLPKAEGAASVNQLLHHANNLPPIMPIATETPGAIFELGSFRKVADKLVGISWGAEDLPAAIGAATSREEDGRYTPPYEMARSLTLFAAHAAGVPAIDTVFPDIKNIAGLSAYVARAARDGFTGMMAIHPSQVAAINEGFLPSQKALADAQAVVDAFAANPDAGALQLNGKMIDAPHLKAAQNIIERAKL